MRSVDGRVGEGVACGRPLALAALFAVLAALSTIGLASPAQAIPSFARQTGQPCGTCHTDFPALTPYGRRFKLLGYTTGGGLYKTTLFSDDARASTDALRAYSKRIDGNADAPPPLSSEGQRPWVPPVAMMAIVGYTRTQGDTVMPPTSPYKANDNVVLSPFSAFWGGAITDHVGALAQVTYNAPGALSGLTGTPADKFLHTWTWDNTDVRFAGTANIGGVDMIYGITANNGPTVQDVWNSSPAFGFPFAQSTLANKPGAATKIEGAYAAHVGGVGGYVFLNDTLYLEASAYKTLDFSQQNAVGVDPFGAPGLIDFAPYWRLAVEPHWGPHSLMLGTFGMISNVHNWIDKTFVLGSGTFSQTDRFTDIGFDSQYQYQGSNYWLTWRSSYIREFQQLNATFNGFTSAGMSANPTDRLDTLRLTGSIAYGSDNRVVLTGQYFKVWGTADSGLYGFDTSGNALTPNSNGWMAELAYIPFGAGKAPGWPWFNARIALQYTYYEKFNGTTVGAQNNNTLFLHIWTAM